jgi:NAD(P)-dependent dehydrogenase (short-subunit alcohol dehydrogenase family)
MGVLERFRLDGKVALITAGAGPLFGSSVTEALAQAGATVITASRSLESNERYAEKLRSNGHDAHGMQVDIADATSIDALAAQIGERFGALDVLVNSALSRPEGMKPIDDVTLDSLEHNAKADVVGFVWTCKAFGTQMAERGRGSIINISSIYGKVGNDPHLYEGLDMKPPIIYPYLKGGVMNFSRGLAAWYAGRGVRVNTISPGGYVEDPDPTFNERYSGRVPLGRMMNNEDIQGAVVFLASDASAYVTGANLPVDGGWTAI